MALSLQQLKEADPKSAKALANGTTRCASCGIKIGPQFMEASVNSTGICRGCEAWQIKRNHRN